MVVVVAVVVVVVAAMRRFRISTPARELRRQHRGLVTQRFRVGACV